MLCEQPSTHKSSTCIVIFTNQMGLEKGKLKVSEITGKIDDIVDQVVC